MGLVKTAGSDFHKNGKNSYLGKNNFSEEEFINFYNKSKNSLDGKIYAPENSSVKWLAEDVKQYKCSDLIRLGRSQTTSNLRRRR